MTYRERRLRRAERLREWAEKLEQKSAAAFGRADTIARAIPFGQPILVGHHSERHARRDQELIHRAMHAGIEHQAKAASMDGRADEIERQADRAIYRDDPDAIEQLRARLADLETQRERMKTINKEIRRGAGWEARIAPPLTDAERTDLATLARVWGAVYKPGYPPYALSNLSGNISRQRQRLADLERRAAPPEPPDAVCPLCDGTGNAPLYTRASGETVIGDCDACHASGRMDAAEADALERRIRDTNAEALRRLDARAADDADPIDDETGQRMR